MRRLTAIALLVAGCSVPGENGSTRSDSAGVELVSYAGPDRPLDWSFDRLFTIGGKETGAESFYALAPGYVGADIAGNLYVLDRSAHRVVVFDSTGAARVTMGRAGGGPGEILRPFGLSVADDGSVGVLDLGKGALVRFDAGGQVLPQEPVPPGYQGGGFQMIPGGLMLILFDLTVRDDDALVQHLIRISGADTIPLVTLRHPPTQPIQLASCGMGFTGMPPIFAPHFRWAGRRDATAAAAVAAGYEVWLIDPHRIRILRRPLSPASATREAALALLGEGMRVGTSGGTRVCDPGEVVEKQGIAETVPIITGIAGGPGQTWWVARSEGAASPAGIDVFDGDGDYLGTLPASAPVPVAVIGLDRFAAIESDELDVDRLVVYRVRPGPGS
jgi:hypothetical protein